MCNPNEPACGVGLCIVMACLYVIAFGLSIDDANNFRRLFLDEIRPAHRCRDDSSFQSGKCRGKVMPASCLPGFPVGRFVVEIQFRFWSEKCLVHVRLGHRSERETLVLGLAVSDAIRRENTGRKMDESRTFRVGAFQRPPAWSTAELRRASLRVGKREQGINR